MKDYTIHTVDTAPEASKPILETVKKNFGFVPNLMATMSESPVLVESYHTMMGLFEKTKLSPTEREIILITNNRLNGCTYCMAAHSTVAKMAGVDADVIEALRSGTSIDNPKLEALRTFAVIIHETHGRPTEEQVDAFLAAGYTKETILEVIVGTSLKVLSNYTTPITEPKLDDVFAPMAWSKETASAQQPATKLTSEKTKTKKTMKISDSTILVTGANRGIGLALVEKALEKGAAKVYATYRSEDNRSTLDGLGERVVPVHLDLGNQATIAQLPQSVPSLNILINNAGIFSAANLLEDTEEQLRDDLGTNFFGTLAVTKALLAALKKAGSGAIANVSSIAGLAAMPSFGGYSASKAALHSLTQSIRGKLKADGISVHGVYPGTVATRMTENFEMETTPASVVAEKILEDVENGVEEIFPDAMAQQVGPLFLSSPKKLEQNFAAF